MKKLTLINLFIMFFLLSCQKSELENIENLNTPIENNPYKVSIDEAKNIALDFMQTFQSTSAASTRSARIQVDNVRVIKVNKATTRSAGIESGMDTLIYAVNFSNNDGYALVGADRRTEPIFGIIDSGSFSNDSIASNPTFAYFLNAALDKAVYDIKENDIIRIAKTRTLNEYENVFVTGTKLSTKWGQGSPYNRYCPNSYPTGCVVTAIAQILSCFSVIGSVEWQDGYSHGSSFLNWNQILTDCRNNNGSLNLYNTLQSANEVAHLMRYLGVVLKAEYKSDGTSIEPKNAINWLNDWTSIKATSLKAYNANEIFKAANAFSNKIVYMRGNSGKETFLGITIKYTGGHAWVADGAFSARRKSDGSFVNLYHFNWGWDGDNNGYFLASVFDTKNPAISESELSGRLKMDSGTSENYRYNVEYSVLEDPNSLGGGIIF